MGLTIYQVDAFASAPFTGNPAAVCILPEPRPDLWMQNVAMEMNLAETAYLLKRDDGYQLRWFTPEVEVDLCGHATLASAHILWETGMLEAAEQARFHTRSGLLTADRIGALIELDFPAIDSEPAEAPDGLLEGLGATPIAISQNRFDYVVELASEKEVRELKPDFALLRRVKGRGVGVTAPGENKYDFVSRFFAPAVGIDEDPVTGSAHCFLGPYWQPKLGKSEFLAYQASRRGGVVRVRLEGDRVRLGGQAITVLRGEWLV